MVFGVMEAKSLALPAVSGYSGKETESFLIYLDNSDGHSVCLIFLLYSLAFS